MHLMNSWEIYRLLVLAAAVGFPFYGSKLSIRGVDAKWPDWLTCGLCGNRNNRDNDDNENGDGGNVNQGENVPLNTSEGSSSHTNPNPSSQTNLSNQDNSSTKDKEGLEGAEGDDGTAKKTDPTKCDKDNGGGSDGQSGGQRGGTPEESTDANANENPEDKDKPLDPSLHPIEVKITTEGSSSENDTKKYEVYKRGTGENYVYIFNDGVKCTMIKCSDQEVWKHEGNHPDLYSLIYKKSQKNCVLIFKIGSRYYEKTVEITTESTPTAPSTDADKSTDTSGSTSTS